MSKVAVIATELGHMTPAALRNAVKVSIRALVENLPMKAENGLIDVSLVDLDAASTDFLVNSDIADDTKISLVSVKDKIALARVAGLESTVQQDQRLAEPNSKEEYEEAALDRPDAFIVARPVDADGHLELADVRITYYEDGSFLIESGIVIEPAIVEPEVIIENPPADSIFAGAGGI